MIIFVSDETNEAFYAEVSSFGWTAAKLYYVPRGRWFQTEFTKKKNPLLTWVLINPDGQTASPTMSFGDK